MAGPIVTGPTASHLTKPLSSLSSPFSLAIVANGKLLVFSVDGGGSSSSWIVFSEFWVRGFFFFWVVVVVVAVIGS